MLLKPKYLKVFIRYKKIYVLKDNICGKLESIEKICEIFIDCM